MTYTYTGLREWKCFFSYLKEKVWALNGRFLRKRGVKVGSILLNGAKREKEEAQLSLQEGRHLRTLWRD